jgi:hypothetical protein
VNIICVSSKHSECNMYQTVTQFIPCLLSKEQKENSVNTCQDLHQRLETDPEFLLKIIIAMRCSFMGTNQKPCKSSLHNTVHYLHTQRLDKFTQLYRVYLLILWHFCSYVQKYAAKMNYKVEFGWPISTSWQCTCSLWCLCAWISGQKQNKCCSCLCLVSNLYLPDVQLMCPLNPNN